MYASPAFDAVDLGLSIPASTFVARAFARRPDQLRLLTREAISHARAGRGFAFIEVLSPCVTYNDTYTEWDAALHDVDADDDYDPTDRILAMRTSMTLRSEGLQPVGLIYRSVPKEKPPTEPDAPLLGPADLDVSPAANRETLRRVMEQYRIY